MKICYISLRSDVGGGPKHMDMLLKARTEETFVASPLDAPYGLEWAKYSHYPLSHRRFSFFSLLGLYFFLRKNDVEIIHSHGFGAGIYSRLLRFLDIFLFRHQLKVIHTYHGLHFTTKKGFNRYLYYFIEKALIPLTDRFVCVSEGELQRVRDWRLFHPEKTQLIFGSVFVHEDSSPFRDVSYFKVLIVARFVSFKNLNLAYDIAKKMKDEDISFVFVGGGELLESFREKLKRDGLKNVVFEGEKDNVDEYLKKSHVFLNTSFVEGLSMGVLEAMERGLPVILSDVEGNHEVVEPGLNGYVVSLDGPLSQWIKRIKELRDNPELREKMGFASIERVKERYSFSLMRENLEALYREISSRSS